MQIIVAECIVNYTGRGNTTLPKAVRLIMLKRDGSVSIHSDDRAYKPLNWMLPPCLTKIEEYDGGVGEPIQRWTVTNKNEELIIDIFKVISDDSHNLSEQEPGLARKWTEKHIQAWLAGHVEEVFGLGWSLVSREYQTGAGPVDLLVLDSKGLPVAVEVKRTGHMGAIDQVCRYVEALKQDPKMSEVTGLVLALDIRPRAKKLAEDRGIMTKEIPPSLYRE